MNPVFAFRFDHRTQDTLVLFNSTADIDPGSLFTSVEREIIDNLVPDEIVIVVREISFEASKKLLAEDSTLLSLQGRLRKRARVTLLGYDEYGKEASRQRVFTSGPAFGLKFDAFKRLAVTSICQTHGAFVEGTPAYHFQNPSKRHTEHFIRLSNILVRGAEISFIAFCHLPLIDRDVRIAYLDTPSLYAIIASINEQTTSFGTGRTPLLADNFRSYQGLHKYDFQRVRDSVVIISASSSGNLANDLVSQKGFELDQIIHVLSLAPPGYGLRIVCDLRFDSDLNPHGYSYERSDNKEGHCKLCAAGSTAINLQGDQFDIAGPQPEPLIILKDFLPKGLDETLHRLVGHRVLQVGLGRPQQRQPRQFHVDPIQLMSSPDFDARLEYFLHSYVPARIRCVISLNKDSDALAQRIVTIAESSGNKPQIVSGDRLEDMMNDTIQPVLIAALSIESGRSLLDVSRDLRKLCPKAPLLYFVGVEKSTGEQRRESLARTLIQCDAHTKHDFAVVDKITLPGSFDVNPWIAELKLLQNIEFQRHIASTVMPIIEARVETLKQTSVPLVDNLFLPVKSGEPLQLQSGFAFWPSKLTKNKRKTQADIFFTIASVLQNLRASASKPGAPCLRSDWFRQSLIAPTNFGRYNDGIIQASLLRGARHGELNFAASPEASKEMTRIIARIISSAAKPRGECAIEFLLALATQRMTLAKEDLLTLKDLKTSAPDLVSSMIDAAIAFGRA